MDAITCLHNRVSMPLLGEPGPNAEQMASLIKAALRAPDHARLTPWRFLVLEGEARNSLGNLIVEYAQQAHPEKSAAELEKLRAKPLRAPTILVVIATITEHPKVPKIEQQISAGAAAANIVNAAYAMGIGAMWRTGGPTYSDIVKKGLGLKEHEEITGFIYLGTPKTALKSVPEYSISDFVEYRTTA